MLYKLPLALAISIYTSIKDRCLLALVETFRVAKGDK